MPYVAALQHRLKLSIRSTVPQDQGSLKLQIPCSFSLIQRGDCVACDVGGINRTPTSPTRCSYAANRDRHPEARLTAAAGIGEAPEVAAPVLVEEARVEAVEEEDRGEIER